MTAPISYVTQSDLSGLPSGAAPSPLLLATWVCASTDSFATMREKRFVVHVAVATWVVMLISVIGWQTAAAAGVFVALASLSAIVGVATAVALKRHDVCRELLVATGFLYSITMFISDMCVPLQTGGGRLMLQVAPTFVFQIAMGGSTIVFFLACAGHGALYIVYAIVQAALNEKTCFAPVSSAATSNPGARIFLEQILPLVIVITGLAVVSFEYTGHQVEASERANWIRAVHDKVLSGSYDAAMAVVEEYRKQRPGSLIEIEEVVGHLVKKSKELALQLAAVPPQRLSKRNSLGSAHSNTFVAFVPAALEHTQSANETLLTATGTGSKRSPDHTPAVPHLSPSQGTTTIVMPYDNTGDAVRPVTPQDLPNDDGELSRRASLRVARRGSMKQPFVREKAFVLHASLPYLNGYVRRQLHSVELVRMILAELVEDSRDVASMFGGTVVMSAMNGVLITFDDCGSACAAALRLQSQYQAHRSHHDRDSLFAEAQPSAPIITVLHASIERGVHGSGPLAVMGYSPALDCSHSIVQWAVETHPESTAAIYIAESVLSLVQDDFECGATAASSVLQLLRAKHVSDEGLALYTRLVCENEDFELPVLERKPTEPINAIARLGTMRLPRLISDPAMGGSGHGSNEGFGSANQSSSQPPDSDVAKTGSFGRSQTSQGARRKLPPDIIEKWMKYDLDRNGHLDQAEMKDVLNDMGLTLNDEEIKQFFEEADADNSGQVTMDEFAKCYFGANIGGAIVMSNIRKMATAMQRSTGADILPIVMNAWKKFDTNGSGSLDAHELRRCLKDLQFDVTHDEVVWIVEKLDRNGNGTIDFDEFASLFSEEDTVADNKLNAVRARIQTVTRVMENITSKEVFSTPDQSLRDERMQFQSLVRRTMWHILFFYSLYNFGLSTLSVAHGTRWAPNTAHAATNFALDTIYIAWFLMKLLLLPREDEHGQIIFQRKDIVKDYVRSKEFVLDVLVVLPLDIIWFSLPASTPNVVYGYFRITKALSMYYVDSFFYNLVGGVNPAVARVLNAVMWFVAVSHVFACFLLFTAGVTSITEDAWNDMTGAPTIVSKFETSYLLAMLWATQMMAGQIRGAALPVYEEQLYLLLVTVLVSIPVFAGILSTISNAVTSESSESEFIGKIDSLRGYFAYTNLPREFEVECLSYYRHLFATTGSMNIMNNPLDDLPIELSIPITVEMGLEMLRKVTIFKTACDNLQFVHELTAKLSPGVIEPHAIVMRKGERGTNMYFVTYGDFHVVAPNGAFVFTIRKGAFFGEIALLHNVKRTATIQCGKRYANVLVLEKRDFEEVAATFPEALSAISASAAGRIKEMLEKEADEARKAKEARRLEVEAQEKAAAEQQQHAPSTAPVLAPVPEPQPAANESPKARTSNLEKLLLAAQRTNDRPETPMSGQATSIKTSAVEK